VGQLTVHVTGNQEREARDAEVALRFTEVQLRPPWRPQGQKLPPLTLHAVLVREEQPPEDVDEPIEWLLLINLPVESLTRAVQVVEWYGCRWQIEVYHKILKSGCQVEDCRLRTADRLQNYIALMSAIAWRLHWLTYVQRADPDRPCTAVLTTRNGKPSTSASIVPQRSLTHLRPRIKRYGGLLASGAFSDGVVTANPASLCSGEVGCAFRIWRRLGRFLRINPKIWVIDSS
jgi:hypothetical protein